MQIDTNPDYAVEPFIVGAYNDVLYLEFVVLQSLHDATKKRCAISFGEVAENQDTCGRYRIARAWLRPTVGSIL